MRRRRSARPSAPSPTIFRIAAARGVVFVGVLDDGSPAGHPITDELLRALADMKDDGNIVPPPSLSVDKRRLGGAEVAVVTVQPSDAPPVRYRGRIWIRVWSRRGIATAQDFRRFYDEFP